jgi:hypothetical protein
MHRRIATPSEIAAPRAATPPQTERAGDLPARPARLGALIATISESATSQPCITCIAVSFPGRAGDLINLSRTTGLAHHSGRLRGLRPDLSGDRALMDGRPRLRHACRELEQQGTPCRSVPINRVRMPPDQRCKATPTPNVRIKITSSVSILMLDGPAPV